MYGYNQISLLYLSEFLTAITHPTTKIINRVRAMSGFMKSIISIVIKFDTLAIQKKNPLTTSDLTPPFSISIKARETNELKPALKTMITKIKKYRF